MIRPIRVTLFQDRKCGLGMPEENPGSSSYHRRISRRAIWRPILLALLFARNSFDNGLIGVLGRRHDFPEGCVRIGSLTKDNRPEPRSQRIPVLKGGVGDT